MEFSIESGIINNTYKIESAIDTVQITIYQPLDNDVLCESKLTIESTRKKSWQILVSAIYVSMLVIWPDMITELEANEYDEQPQIDLTSTSSSLKMQATKSRTNSNSTTVICWLRILIARNRKNILSRLWSAIKAFLHREMSANCTWPSVISTTTQCKHEWAVFSCTIIKVKHRIRKSVEFLLKIPTTGIFLTKLLNFRILKSSRCWRK